MTNMIINKEKKINKLEVNYKITNKSIQIQLMLQHELLNMFK